MTDAHPKKNRGGRPSIYTPAIADEICQRIEAGEALVNICNKSAHLPAPHTVRQWLCDPDQTRYNGFAINYARARESQADTIYEEIQDIEAKVQSGEIDPQAGRVLIDSKKWRAGKMKPKKYGDRVDIAVDPDSLDTLLLRIAQRNGPPRPALPEPEQDSQSVIDVTPIPQDVESEHPGSD